jgi:hypothetical protein
VEPGYQLIVDPIKLQTARGALAPLVLCAARLNFRVIRTYAKDDSPGNEFSARTAIAMLD